MQRLPNYLSDHNAIALLSEKLDWRPSPFRFYDHWLLEEGFDKLVSEAWVKENSVCAWSKLRNLKNVIKEWKKSKLNTLDDRINMVEKDLAIIDARWTEGVVTNEDKQSKALLTSQLWKLFRMKEMQWKQKSRLNWLKCGDKNTRFFHTIAKIRKRNNNVEKLMHKDRLVTDKQEIQKLIFNHFSDHFSSSFNDLHITMPGCSFKSLTSLSSESLENNVTEEEVWSAVLDCGSSKAPGPDGFNMGFIKK